MKFFELPVFQICTAIMYFFLASQGGFYLLSFAKVLRLMSTAQFLEIRKAIDQVIENRLKVLYPSTLVFMIIWTLIADNTEAMTGRGLLILSTVLLFCDLILALRVSIPLNRLIHHISDASAAEARDVKKRWLRFIVIRACLSVSGFAMLLIHLFNKV